MNLATAINIALEKKLKGEPVSWVELAQECHIHPERLRSKVRRRLQAKRDYLERKPVVYNEPIRCPKPYKGNPNNVLVIGDLHAPFIKEGYLEFCREVQERFDCGTVIQIGDLIDGHAWNYHEHDPDGMSTGDELQQSIRQLKKLWKMFPEGICTLGNHDLLIMRKAFSSGLSKRFIREFSEIIEAPKTWKFVHEYIKDDVMYVHGTGSSGENAAFIRAKDSRINTVMGHIHSYSYVKYVSSYKDLLWAMQVGWGGDNKKYAFEYGSTFPKKPVLSCGVVLNNGKLPIILPMEN